MEVSSSRCHEYSVLVNVLIEFFTCKQKKGSKLSAYKKVFEACKNAVENTIGTEWIQAFAMKTETYKALQTVAERVEYLEKIAINEFLFW